MAFLYEIVFHGIPAPEGDKTYMDQPTLKSKKYLKKECTLEQTNERWCALHHKGNYYNATYGQLTKRDAIKHSIKTTIEDLREAHQKIENLLELLEKLK